MDNSETESNCSFHSDSLQSNASSLSGLSLYRNEFVELRHLVNPTKYPQAHLERSSTPKAELIIEDDKLKQLKNDLQQSLELNEKYKLELHNLEKKIELKYCDKIDKLLRSNSRLEGELETANNQIERLIKSHKANNDQSIFKEKIDLEKRVHQLSLENSKLQILSARAQQDKIELELENKTLKISLGELDTEREIKSSSVESLKLKITDQHIEIQNSLKNINNLNEEINSLNINLVENEKSKLWYKEQLTVCKNDKNKAQEELIRYKDQLAEYDQKIYYLNIDLSKCKNEVDNVRLQALKEKEELFKKLENINLNCNIISNVPADFTCTNNNPDMKFHEEMVADLREELCGIKTTILQKDTDIEKLIHENSIAISKCLVLQQTLKQKENEIELLESSKNELLMKLTHLKKNEKENLSEILNLKNRVTEWEVEAKLRNQEKQDVERSIQLIKDQFLQFKNNYEKLKHELNLRDKEILRLQKDKHELFMNNNWTICELEKLKQKDATITDLKKENETLTTNVETLKHNIRELEFQILNSDKVIREKDDCINELMIYKNTSNQHKVLIADYEETICKLKNELTEILERYSNLLVALDDAKTNIQNKDLKLNEMLKKIDQKQNENLNNSALYKNLQEKHRFETKAKDQIILNLQNKLDKVENDWQSYLKRITDDQKIELLLNNKNSFDSIKSSKTIESFINNFFNSLNVEEFESSVNIRLKCLNDRINTIRAKTEQFQGTFKNGYGHSRIKELEILLQVKDREVQEKRKRMDRNNRTLLRKVKEHMRGRNAAEKQLKYLQDLYNVLADEQNTSTLSINSKDIEIKSLKEFCESYQREIDKLRKTVRNLEQEIYKTKICEGCVEVDNMKEKLLYFETFCQDIQQKNTFLENELESLSKQIKEQEGINILNLQKTTEVLMKNEDLKDSLSKFQDIERNSELQKQLINRLESALLDKENAYEKSVKYHDIKSLELIDAKEKIEFLSKEIQMRSSDLQQKAEYSKELETKMLHMEERHGQSNKKHEKILLALKQKVLLLQNEIKILTNDKFFFRRLSNDLKVALKSYTLHNKKLQEQINSLSVNQQPIKTLPAIGTDNITISGKYDEKQITQLLEDNRSPLVNKTATAEIQGCLNKLREEIYSLQEQISKKNIKKLGIA